MNDQELFDKVKNRFAEQYKLTYEYPYNDGYMEVYNKNHEMIGDMNSDGYNLLYNLTRLTAMLKDELI